MEPPQKSGGIENTLVYWLGEEISHLNFIFITVERLIKWNRQTVQESKIS